MTGAEILHNLYLFTAIFGVGVTIIDLLGVLGHGHDGGHSGHGAHDCADGTHAHDGSTTDHQGHHVPVLSALYYLRMLVYFSLGFGPLGLMAEATGASMLGALAWALPAGVIAALLGRLVFKFQQRVLDSSVKTEDLFLGNARVIVPISKGNMGKVRINIGQSVAERYALPEDANESFPTDAEVEVVRVTDDCLYVRRASQNSISN